MRRLAALALLAAVMLTGCTTPKASPAASTPPAVATPAATRAAVTSTGTFATPEAAVTAYLHGLAAGDPTAILATCGIDEMVAGYDFQAAARRLASFRTMGMSPGGTALYDAANRAWLTDQFMSGVQAQTYSLLSTLAVDQTYSPLDEKVLSGFVADVDPSKLAGLTTVSIGEPTPSVSSSARNRSNEAQQATVYRADQQVSRVALLSLNGTTYMAGFTLTRWGASWKVSSQSAPLVAPGDNGPDAVVPMSAADFKALISG